ncbi:MAG: Uma2 family endonuclease [archaeon]|nr:Uma2 family endonuclease [archaeon]
MMKSDNLRFIKGEVEIISAGGEFSLMMKTTKKLGEEMERKEIEGAKDKEEYMSYEDFLDFCDEDTLAEWVNGKIVRYSPASYGHQDLARWLISLLSIYLEIKKLGVICPAPFQMKTGRDLPGREPDIIFVREENLSMLKNTYLEGPADLVIEIVSEESRLRDRGEKFAEYEIGGVKEYWVLDPDLKRADFFILKERRYERRVEDEHGVYHSEIIQGFWIRGEWLWNPPPVLDVLKEMELV